MKSSVITQASHIHKTAKRLVRIEAETELFRNIFFVDWSTGNTCNYKCSYCPSNLSNGSLGWLKFQDFENFCTVLLPQIPAQKQIMFSFTGGETSMWPDFLECCKYLKSQERSILINFLSNGSRTMNWWEKAYPYFDRVLLSYHHEFTDRKHFIEVANFVKQRKNVVAHFLMKRQYFKELLEAAKEVYAATGIRISLQPVMNNLSDIQSSTEAYSPEEREVFIKQYEWFFPETTHDDYRGKINLIYDDHTVETVTSAEIHARVINTWKNFSCNIGLEQLSISNEGYISRGWCLQGNTIGNIFDKNFRLPQAPILCQKNFCNNLADMCSAKSLL